MEQIQVGEFTLESDGKTVSGPAAYMNERGSAKLRAILSGHDTGFNTMLMFAAPERLLQTILIALQTDYAGWKGMQQFHQSFRA